MRLFATALLIGAEIALLLYLERSQRPEAPAPVEVSPKASLRVGGPPEAEESAPAAPAPRAPASESAPLPVPRPFERVTRSPAGAPASAPSSAPASRTVPYTIKSKDSLIRIAKRHGVDWKDIAKANGNVDPKRLKVGQVLKIPILAKADPPPRR